MTSVLILGALHGQAEAMTRLKERGWRVIACGHRREGPGVVVAEEFHLVDIRDVDAVAALAQKTAVDVVYSVGSDIAMPTVARVSERLGLPHFHDVATTEVLHRKVLLRQFLNDHGLSPVSYRSVRSSTDLDGYSAYPAIVKPSDSQGQRGIAIVGDRSAAVLALPDAVRASSTSTAIIEELLDGPEISIHVFVVDGVVRFFLPSDRHVWDGPMTGVAHGHVLPAEFLEAADVPALRALVEQVVAALGVQTGPLYFQIKLTSHGPRIIEIAPRLDGCHLWRLVEIHTGFNILDRCFDLLAGESWIDPAPWSDDPGHSLWFLLGDPAVPFRVADHPPAVDERVVYSEAQVDEGALPRDSNGVIARLGYRIIEDRS